MEASKTSPTKKTVIPGYSGYIPKGHQYGDMTQKKVSNDPKKTIPGKKIKLIIARLPGICPGHFG